MSNSIIFNFTNEDNYNFDTKFVEFDTGIAKLKDTRPATATLYAKLFSSLDANWGNGVLTGTPIGGAAIDNNMLDCTGELEKYVSYPVTDNGDSTQTGCIRFIYKPNFSGLPLSDKVLIHITGATDANTIILKHKTTGFLNLTLYDNTAAEIINEDLQKWVQNNQTEYEFEINWDITSGSTRLFINGNQIGSVITDTGTRDQTNISTIHFGGTVSSLSDGYFSKLLIYSSVQHTENYLPDWTDIYDTILSTSNPTITSKSSIVATALTAFTETAVKTNSELKYQLYKSGIWYYHNGSEWTISDGTYSQSNTAAEINTNINDFISLSKSIRIKIFLHSDNGTDTPEADSIQVDYDYNEEPEDIIQYVKVWAYQKNNVGAISNNPITVYLSRYNTQYKQNTMIYRQHTVIKPDPLTGYWEVSLVETDNMAVGTRYIFDFNSGDQFVRQVPSTTDKINYYDLPE